ncbi:MAG: ABC transporter permease [Chloroflexi bacterium]|nr:ABC transporter permease [Chloroflexota bacterium]
MTFAVLFSANVKLIYRNRQALFWSLAFPLLFLVILGLSFGGNGGSAAAIGVVDRAQDEVSKLLLDELDSLESVEVILREDESAAREEVRNNDLYMLLVIPPGLAASVASGRPVSFTLVYDQGSSASGLFMGIVQRYLDQLNLSLAGAPRLLTLDPEGVLADQVTFLDFLLPGLVAMGIMTASIFGISSAMASYRERRILRRLLAAPVRARDFFSAMVVAYLMLAIVQATIIFAAGVLLFGLTVNGNPGYIALLILMGNAIFFGIGFIVGSVARSVQAAAGLGNAVIWPMMLLAGVFFETDQFPYALRVTVKYLPLTPMVDSLRGVVLDSRSILDFPGELALMGVWIAVTTTVALRVLRST